MTLTLGHYILHIMSLDVVIAGVTESINRVALMKQNIASNHHTSSITSQTGWVS